MRLNRRADKAADKPDPAHSRTNGRWQYSRGMTVAEILRQGRRRTHERMTASELGGLNAPSAHEKLEAHLPLPPDRLLERLDRMASVPFPATTAVS